MNEWFESVQEEVVAFLCGRTFIVATAIFFLYLFVTGILRRFKNFVVGIFKAIIAAFSPFRFRRLLINFIMLVFMVGGISLACGAKAKLGGSDGILEAIVGGGFALGLWGFIVLIANQFRNPEPKTESEEPKSKVKPPSSFKKET